MNCFFLRQHQNNHEIHIKKEVQMKDFVLSEREEWKYFCKSIWRFSSLFQHFSTFKSRGFYLFQ